ncbi:hypothetical protein V6x_27460 [Gimesia chilikensis]|uniref:Uncharacterized protein n=1 Tax=Gimesia chilikensis TaxID=2605989 RepID=A0A517WCQ7_9PLAN|nr:hypothetical protein V6x_27460 [Gimesia chilikensis]
MDCIVELGPPVACGNLGLHPRPPGVEVLGELSQCFTVSFLLAALAPNYIRGYPCGVQWC